ncbi:MAG: thioredoxin family protein [Phormidesmis priestleyi]|uniref:Thioredoxin family protein n=1 Tax=Phormidesmis priestleyi TaxID=268141 RepID=A0A2W4XK34_9CYAN|nr:MAG: thioredoxin family protein [Phormidesmis priestleyi]
MVTHFFRGLCLSLISLLAVASLWLGLGSAPALAELNDDHYDGNIFALYAGNGSIVPPRFNLAQSLQQDKPTLLVFYADDSRDSKQFSSVISQLQAPYGRVANVLAIAADSVPVKDSYAKNESGYYFTGSVPQTVIFEADGTVVFNEVGQVPYEIIDDKMREIFNLLPREESAELRRRPINEVNGELVSD